MSTGLKIIIAVIALLVWISAVKPYYGGEIIVRLNEPTNFSYMPSDYSNLVFYSLLYENLFYLKSNGELFSNVFSNYKYNANERTLALELKENLSFSNGDPVRVESIKLSLELFLNLKVENAFKLRRIIKNIEIKAGENRILIRLLYDHPEIVTLLSAPELVLMSGGRGVYSGMFYPVEWEQNRFLRLAPNLYNPGGRTYLDSVQIIFYDYQYPDIFLAKPGLTDETFKEFNAGIYQNIYLGFPAGKMSPNIQIALYSLLREFAGEIDMEPLNVLTADEESPVSLKIKTFSDREARSILRRSRVKLYILSSLKDIEGKFADFLNRKNVQLETIYLNDNTLDNFMDSAQVNYLLQVKIFNKRVPLEEKIKRIVNEMSFSRFDENYLKLVHELEEVALSKNEELLLEQVSNLIEKIVNDGLLLPLFQKRYSIYVKNKLKDIEMDYYGRPLFQRMQIDRQISKQ
jgi:MarR-like DNA-binding transcriptional regulator SgrR of sgrS sRNA